MAYFSITAIGPSLDLNPWKPPRQMPNQKSSTSCCSYSSDSNAPLRNPKLSPPGLGSFRPPNLGFGVRVDDKSAVSDEEKLAMVETIKGDRISWHKRANMIWELQQMEFTSEQLYEAAMVSPLEQTTMVAAARVYDSLVSAGASDDLLSAFDHDSWINSLYELRILSQKQRKAAAEFVLEKKLDAKGAQEVAKAIKQYERRSEIREGFSPIPGDCYALMHYRAAVESSQEDEKRLFAERALEFAVSEAAKQKIRALLEKL